MKPGRRETSPPDPRQNTRLAYSTGGETAPAAAAPVPAATANRGVRLRLERRASGRVVTLVGGLPGTPDDVAQLARELRSACGTGGTIKDGSVELQGDHRDAVEARLRALGIPSKRAGG